MKCHDKDGTGEHTRSIYPQIPDFTDPGWQDSRTDLDLLHSISEGRGKIMRPMKQKLVSAEVQQLVSFVRGFREGKQVVPDEGETTAPAEPAAAAPTAPGPAVPAPVAQESPRPDHGRRLFQQFCTRCHRPDGAGAAKHEDVAAIPNFTDPAWQVKRSDAQLVAIILEGKGTRMPAFRGHLGDREARDLVALIRAFNPRRTPSPAVPASAFGQRFQQLQKQFDDLQTEARKLPAHTGNRDQLPKTLAPAPEKP